MDQKDLSNWMSHLPEALHAIPLIHLAIPGSHDSGAYDLTTEMAPSASPVLKFLASLPGYSKLFGNAVLAIATCQTLTIGKQLEAGIRHLDFRVSSKPGKQDIYFVHSVFGTKVRDALTEIKTFLDKHPREVVIVDIQHFHDMDATQHAAFISLLKSTFGSKLCHRMNMKDLNLSYLWNKKKQIICIYQDGSASEEPALWTSKSIRSPWPNTTSPEDCISKLTQYMDQAQNLPGTFFVCQGLLNPDTLSMIAHPFLDRSVKTMTTALNPLLKKWLTKSCEHWGHQPNVVIHDFVELDGYVQNVIDLNKDRILPRSRRCKNNNIRPIPITRQRRKSSRYLYYDIGVLLHVVKWYNLMTFNINNCYLYDAHTNIFRVMAMEIL